MFPVLKDISTNSQNISGSELTLSPGDPNITPVRAGACGGQVVRRVSAQVSHVSQWVPDLFWVLSPALECTIGMDTLKSRQNPHNGSLTCGERAIIVRKAKQRPLELPLTRKIVTQKKSHIPEGNAGISAAIKDLKDEG